MVDIGTEVYTRDKVLIVLGIRVTFSTSSDELDLAEGCLVFP